LLDRLGERIELERPVGELPLAQRQMVALARALSQNCRLLIMDEPTASLSLRETTNLLNIVRQLRNEGVSVLYVSHRLEEVFRIADRVTVLRDGRHVTTRNVAELNTEQLIQLMVGRDIAELTRRHGHGRELGAVVLDVRELTRTGVFHGITLSVRSGEIVGLAGLVGAGRSEVARALFGIDRYDAGQGMIEGKRLAAGSVTEAMSAGMALVPEDRQHEGLVLPMTVGENLSLAVLRSLKKYGLLSRRMESELIDRQMRELAIKAAGPRVAARTLSGGNQQKLVLGKWLASRPKALLLDEPTRGVDVGAKAQVHRLIRQLADEGLATLVISSDMPELLSISDRILVMRQGHLSGELDGPTATQEQILQLALPDVNKAQVA
jgi:rhamnose transport system ATP-binding protein